VLVLPFARGIGVRSLLGGSGLPIVSAIFKRFARGEETQ